MNKTTNYFDLLLRQDLYFEVKKNQTCLEDFNSIGQCHIRNYGQIKGKDSLNASFSYCKDLIMENYGTLFAAQDSFAWNHNDLIINHGTIIMNAVFSDSIVINLGIIKNDLYVDEGIFLNYGSVETSFTSYPAFFLDLGEANHDGDSLGVIDCNVKDHPLHSYMLKIKDLFLDKKDKMNKLDEYLKSSRGRSWGDYTLRTGSLGIKELVTELRSDLRGTIEKYLRDHDKERLLKIKEYRRELDLK